mgnify:CR=1 FL=1|tara:strand:+ start:9689 stop:10840 length:1152 start_codon:yes stop_codon:yes gene_type:complete
MKICYVLNNSFGEHDPKFISKMSEREYSVVVFSMSRNRINNEKRFDKINYYEMSEYHPRLSKSLSNFSILRYPLYILWFFFAFIHLNAIIKKTKPDILHGGYVPISGFLCSLINFHPFLLMPWGSDILIFPDKTFLHKLLISFIIKRSDSIVCDAEVVRKKIIEIDSNQINKDIVLFPWGINLDMFNSQKKSSIREKFDLDDKFVIICTRNHESIYGIDILLESLNDLIKIDKRIYLFLLGSGSLTSNYKKYIESNSLLDNVNMPGRIRNSELPLYLTSSDIYVSSSYSDGTSICLLEAMACQLSVVVSNISSNCEWVKNGINGYLFEKGSSSDLTEKIKLLMQNKELRKKQASYNMQIAKEKADWNVNFKKLERVYSSMIGG